MVFSIPRTPELEQGHKDLGHNKLRVFVMMAYQDFIKIKKLICSVSIKVSVMISMSTDL